MIPKPVQETGWEVGRPGHRPIEVERPECRFGKVDRDYPRDRPRGNLWACSILKVNQL
ncbi:hypothetical protein [Alkalinema sp. FACHB-956]|uniref:hypothetical protein n=1 Tax=Alkalinema sp. FACHB-956 TaxID=2692768 RepID=UPI001681D61B|nr:hypothetical protein [Alkalinema sp. FACHB-956]MBD2327783.1 hypothetical protein [Alkalinema sp. FACHB-956]